MRFVQYLLHYGLYSQICITYRLSYEALSHMSILDGHFTAQYNLQLETDLLRAGTVPAICTT